MTNSKFSAEGRERAVRMVREQQAERGSEWATVQLIAGKPHCTAETLRRWVRRAQIDQGEREGRNTPQRERLKAFEREVRELRQADEILRKASAFQRAVGQRLRRLDRGRLRLSGLHHRCARATHRRLEVAQLGTH